MAHHSVHLGAPWGNAFCSLQSVHLFYCKLTIFGSI